MVNQKVACRILEKLGYRVDVAADGQAAFDAWQSGRYQLILMDCQMPIMDGYETTRKIREHESGGKRIPIIALTAHAMKGADNECRAAGMDDYLSKPIDREQLQLSLNRWLNDAVGGRLEESAARERAAGQPHPPASRVRSPSSIISGWEYPGGPCSISTMPQLGGT